MKRGVRQEIQRVERVVISAICNADSNSRKRLLGYEIAIMQQKETKTAGMVEFYPKHEQFPRQIWDYDVSELFWVYQGFVTLLDAQKRNVLDRRGSWKPYEGHCYAPLAPWIESLGVAAISLFPAHQIRYGDRLAASVA
jgi:hypothetical protein